MTKHKIKNGRLFDNDVRLEVHERRTVDYLLQQGKDIELISPSYNLYSKSPDFWMDGVAWELKCPCVTKLERISYLFRYATKQSPQVIFDLRNIKGDSAGVIKHLQKLFHISRRVRRLIIIGGGDFVPPGMGPSHQRRAVLPAKEGDFVPPGMGPSPFLLLSGFGNL